MGLANHDPAAAEAAAAECAQHVALVVQAVAVVEAAKFLLADEERDLKSAESVFAECTTALNAAKASADAAVEAHRSAVAEAQAARDATELEAATNIQRVWRGYLGRKFVAPLKEAAAEAAAAAAAEAAAAEEAAELEREAAFKKRMEESEAQEVFRA